MISFGQQKRIPLCILVLAVFTGCGKSQVGNISGKVTLAKKPLNHGMVMIVGSDNKAYYGKIDPGGNYQVKGVPYGSAKVAVNSPDPDGQPPDKRFELGGRKKRSREPVGVQPVSKTNANKAPWFPIPIKYGNHLTSGLSLEVNEKTMEHNIMLAQEKK